MKGMNNIVTYPVLYRCKILKTTHAVLSLDILGRLEGQRSVLSYEAEPFARREPLNSFHGQLQLAFMPRFAYRCETISRALGLISVSDAFASCKKRS